MPALFCFPQIRRNTVCVLLTPRVKRARESADLKATTSGLPHQGEPAPPSLNPLIHSGEPLGTEAGSKQS